MLFDRLVGLAECSEHLHGLRKLLAAARVFDCRDLPMRFDAQGDELSRHMDMFFLPFRCVAVECSRDKLILVRDRQRDQRGFYGDREFYGMLNVSVFSDLPGFDECNADGFLDHAMLVVGFDASVDGSARHIDIETHTAVAFTEVDGTRLEVDLFEMELPGYVSDFLSEEAVRMVVSVFAGFTFINQPGNFILEQSPVKVRHRKGRKILRSHDRPIYTLLRPAAIRKRMRLPEPSPVEKGKKRPHERRAHIRRLTSDRFVNKRGREIFIPAIWVGPSENVVGNKRYRVLLDK